MRPKSKTKARTTKKEPSRKRVQLDFTEEAHAKLQELQQRAGTQTNAETVRNALRLYDWFLLQKEKGRQIQAAEKERVIEIELVF